MVNDANIDALELNAKLRSEIAGEYGISVKTLNRWIKNTNLVIPHGLIDPFHFKMIYHKFGIPKYIK